MFLSHKTDLSSNYKKSLPQYQHKRALMNDSGQFKLVNNVCPHQKSIIISGLHQEFRCQYHSWEWNNKGEPKSNGTTSVCNNYRLLMKEAYIRNSLVFSDDIDITSVPIDFSHMRIVEQREEVLNTRYGNIIDVFLDVDHISVVHPEVYTKVGLGKKAQITWEYYKWGNIQFVHKNNEYDDRFNTTLLGTDEEKLAAVWITVYPYTTIDWQPGQLVVVVCVPSKNTTKTIINKYRDIRYSDLNWQINSDIWETAWIQDSKQAESIVGDAIESHLEIAKLHYRNWEKLHGKI